MVEAILRNNLAVAGVMFVVAFAGGCIGLFGGATPKRSPTARSLLGLTVRSGLLVLFFLGFASLSGVGLAWIAVVCFVLVLFAFASPQGGDGLFFLLLGHLMVQWVLGFPDRAILVPGSEATASVEVEKADAMPVSRGDEGTTVSALKPTGEAVFGGHRCAVTAAGGRFVDASVRVRVIGVNGGDIVVAPQQNGSQTSV